MANKLTFDTIREKGLLIYEYIRGSHAYGLATETSDEDRGGVYIRKNCSVSDLNTRHRLRMIHTTSSGWNLIGSCDCLLRNQTRHVLKHCLSRTDVSYTNIPL